MYKIKRSNLKNLGISSRFVQRAILRVALPVSAGLVALPLPAKAFTYEFNNGVQVRFDNNVEYSLGIRTAPTSKQITNNINGNDGDLNLSAGVVSNRTQDITTLDLSDNGYGFDVSAESFYDSAYESKTQNGSQATYNPIGSASKYANGTSALVGRNIELRNLFGYGSFSLGNVPIDFRIGRHTLIWGESLFFPDNGIAYGMAPLDGVEATTEPNAEVKDLFLPVGMASISAQLTDSLRLESYYQFEWEKTIIPPVGSYYSPSDIFDGGGQRIILAQPQLPFFPGAYFFRGRDIRGATTGQFGIALHYDPDASPYDFGIYALQYNDREPQVYISPGVGGGPTPNGISEGQYRLVYPNHIQLYGISGSTTVGAWNIAGEISARMNVPLVNNGVIVGPGEQAGNSNHVLYPTGDAGYAQISTIYLGPATKLWGASSFVAELAGNQLFSVLKNADEFVASNGGGPGHWNAIGFHGVFTPTYYEVIPGVDLSVPLGLGYNFWGQSPTTHTFNGTDQSHGGVATIGVSAAYLQTWNAALSYNQYFGPVAYGQLYADRSLVTFNLQHTF
jgi:hypothetical protein